MPRTHSNFHRPPQASAAPAEIVIYDVIGYDWWTGEGITAKTIKKQLEGIPLNQEITLRINSPGGTVSEALAIYNLLRERSDKVTAIIDGYAASAASFIPLAADKRISPKSSLWMIHSPWGVAFGNAEDFRHEAEVLDKHDEAVMDIYVERTGQEKDQLKNWLLAETWFTGEEALDLGFATQLGEDLSENIEQFLPKQFQNRLVQSADWAKVQRLGWRFPDMVPEKARAVKRVATIVTPPPGVKQEKENEKMDELNQLQQQLTEKVDEIKALRLQVSQIEETNRLLQNRLDETTLIQQYWQLRSRALELYGCKNQLTEEDLRLDFSEDPQIDLERFQALPKEEALLDLKMLDRTLRRAEIKQPIDRLRDKGEQTLLNNDTIKSYQGDGDPGARNGNQTPLADRYLAKNPVQRPY